MRERREIKEMREEIKKNLEARVVRVEKDNPTKKWTVDSSSGFIQTDPKKWGWSWNCQ